MFVLGFALLLGLLAGLTRPFEEPYPVDLDAPYALLHYGQHVSGTFYPTGYQTIVLAGLALAGRRGVMLVQVLTYMGLVGSAYAALRLLLIPAGRAAVGAVLVGLDPQFLIAINRIVDLNAVAPLLIALVSVSLWIRRDGFSWVRALLLGLTVGGLFAVRPNLVSVVPVAIVLVWHQIRWPQVVLAIVATPIPILVTSSIMLGHPALPTNAAYTFAQGANSYSETELLHNYNAELSLNHYLGHFKVSKLPDLQAPSKQGPLVSFGLNWIKDHPAQYVKLIGIKLYTLLRPDLRPRTNRVPLSKFERLVEILSALPVVIWLIAVALARRRRVSTAPLSTRIVVLFVALYLFPFVLTNGDPRLGYPVDTVLLLQTAAIFGRWRKKSESPSGQVNEPTLSGVHST
jgi:hypothetical protein